MLGDMNVTLASNEHSSGGSFMTRDMNEFRNCINNIDMDDVASSGLFYTWTKNLLKVKAGNTSGDLKKLDRIIGNETFIAKFGQALAIFLPYLIFDHCPNVLIFPKAIQTKKRIFKFSNFPADKEEFFSFGEVDMGRRCGWMPNVQKFKQMENMNMLNKNKLSEAEANEMVRDVSDAKIKEAVFLIDGNKAPGPDGNRSPTNIILQGLPPEVYALVSTHKIAKELWERIQMLMQGTSLTKQERECKLYDAFDKFAYQKGETLQDFYLRFLLLLNDMNMYNMKLEQFQVNMKFLNTLPSEWSKFVTDVKLVRDLHTTNVDQLHAFLGQHEYHANEVRPMNEQNSDPLALISQHQLSRTSYPQHQPMYQQSRFHPQAASYQSSPYGPTYHNSQFVSSGPSSLTHSISYPGTDTSSLFNHDAYLASSSAPQIAYTQMDQ
nr:RNA-directed DNA polymerase, eukaryota, reverse transcriptase zinc-binding domain protein [Tanacetum cinerariifolium]